MVEGGIGTRGGGRRDGEERWWKNRCPRMNDDGMFSNSSKDTFVKLWDLDTYHCFQTVVGHKSEVTEVFVYECCVGVCRCV